MLFNFKDITFLYKNLFYNNTIYFNKFTYYKYLNYYNTLFISYNKFNL